jgi:5-formyltetrahydrofolate cyclo-ligase
MTKEQIRKEYREKRLALGDPERDRLDDLMLISFQSAPIPFIHSLLSFWPIDENHEPNTHLATGFLKFRNPEMRTAYPVCDFTAETMVAMLTDADTPFVKKQFNMLEPSQGDICSPGELDMVFVPLLAFDKSGYRVGYGKGFYDRFLQDCREDCLKVGFSYFDPIPGRVPRHEFDVPLNLCITPQQVYVF